jgi:hypothetical protein
LVKALKATNTPRVASTSGGTSLKAVTQSCLRLTTSLSFRARPSSWFEFSIPVKKLQSVGLILVLCPGPGLVSPCTRNDQLTAFKQEYSPVPIAKFATAGTADRSFYCNDLALGKQPRIADLLILGPTGTRSPVQSIPFGYATSIFLKDNNGLISNSAFEPRCYLIASYTPVLRRSR